MNTRVVLTIGAVIVALAALAHASPIPSAPQDGVVPEVEAAQKPPPTKKWLDDHDHDFDPDLEHTAKVEDEHQPEDQKLTNGDLAKIPDAEAEADNGKVVKKEKDEEEKKEHEEEEEKKSEQEYVHRTSLIEACYSGDGCKKCMKKCPACKKSNPALKWPAVPYPPNKKCRECAKGDLDAYDIDFGMDWKKNDCLKCTRCHSLDEKPPKCFKQCRAILTVCPICKSSKKDIEDHFTIGTPHFDETATDIGWKCSQCASNADNAEIQQSFKACKACYGLH